MKDDSIKIEIENEEKIENTEVKGENDMESENKTVVNDFGNEKLENLRFEIEEADIFFILDRSGSMYGSETDTINGFNAFIEKQMAKNHNIKVTTVLFDSNYEVLYSRKPIDEVKPLTSEDYYVRGSTALLDTIGKTVTSFDRKVNKGMFIINTDGLENASREFSRGQIKDMVENSGFEFIFIGADIDSYAEASKIGINRSHVANYSKTSQGIGDLYDSVDQLATMFCKEQKLDLVKNDSWKEKLD